jgi:hypothetical protein
MADIDYSKYGATPEVDYSKYGAVEDSSAPSFMDKAMNMASKVPDALYNIATKNPVRTLKNIGAGALELGQNIINAPHDFASILPNLPRPEGSPAPLEIPHMDDKTAQIQKLTGTENPDIGDKLQQGLVANAMGILPGMKIAGAIGKSIFDSSKVAEAKTALTAAEEASQAAEEAHNAASAQEAQIKEEAKIDIGKQTPADIQRGINQKEAALNETQQHADALAHQMDNLPATNAGEATAAREQAEQHLNTANEIHSANQLAAVKAEKDISDYLNVGNQHDVETATGIQKAVKDNENYWSGRYKNLVSNLQDSQFKMPENSEATTNMDSIMAQLRAGIHPRDINPTESEYSHELQNVLDKAPTSSDTNVSSFLDKFKDFKDTRNSLIRDLKNAPSASARAARIKAYNDSQPMQDTMQQALEEGMGKFAPEFKEVNQGYANSVYPLRNNEHVIMAQKKGRLPANMVQALRGNAEGQAGVGQSLVRQIIQNDPKLLRNVVGQRYAANAEEIHNPNATMQEYLDKIPELKALNRYKENVNTALDKSKQNIETAQANHKLAIESEKNELEKSGKVDKERDQLQKKIGAHQDEISKLQKDIPRMQEHLEKVRAAANRKGQTLAEKIKSKEEEKLARDKLERTHTTIKKLGLLTKALGGKLVTVGKPFGYAGAALYGAKHIYDLFSPEEEH